ncbi:MAG TPA: SdiA-regulated domain-containing protein [Chitinophagaceae bacterium]
MAQKRSMLEHFILFKILLLIIFFGVTFLSACSSKSKYQSPPGYDLSKPDIYTLPTSLDEISGVVYYPKDSSVFAIQDEKGWLFKIHLTSPLRIEKWKFSNSGDYEDVALVDSTFFVLKSKGVIEKFKFQSPDSVELQSFNVPEDAKNEFETLYYDSSLHRLFLICKDCEDDKKNQVNSWSFDPVSNSFSTSFVIETSAIREQLNEKDQKLKPSAAAIDPLTGELYVLASVNKALVILNKDHTVKNSYKIDPNLFKQPEGIAFTPKGGLIISNEAAEKSSADILFFKYDKSKHPQ